MTTCVKCNGAFGILVRKHHCRACGNVFCSKCLAKKIPVTGYANLEKACVTCVSLYEGNGQKEKSLIKLNADLSFADSAKIQALCASFHPQVMNAGHRIANISKIMMDQAVNFVPAPINSVCSVTSELLALSNNCVVNTAEACRLADRVSRIMFAVLRLSIQPSSFEGSALIASQLLKVLRQSVELLEVFQPPSKSQSFVEVIMRKLTIYSSSTVETFTRIHEDLSMIMQDRLFVSTITSGDSAAVAVLASPTLEQITQGIRQEISHVMEEVRKSELESGTRLEQLELQLQSVLSGLSGADSRASGDIVVLDPRAVQIDTTRQLGKGASGSVFAGLLYGSTEVAVKVLLNIPPIDSALEEVRKELEYTVRVSHRNVVKVYGLLSSCTEFEGRAAVVMERLGGSLDTVIGKLRPPSYMKLVNDIIAGMARVHDQDDGVVHFDLKPANILLTLDGRTAKVVDFGIAQSKTTVAFASASDTARARGTVAYMAPEILLGTFRGFYCDVYSFGVLVYTLWSGKKPWQGFGDAAIITAVQQGTRPATDVEMIAFGMPEPIIALIISCWDHSPGCRPSFKSISVLREIDAFWEAPVNRWPQCLLLNPSVQSLLTGGGSVPPVPPNISSSSTTPSAGASIAVVDHSSFTFSGTTASAKSQVMLLGVGGASVPAFSSDQLCEWLQESQGIDVDIVSWLREKRIKGDTFASSGDKIVQKLRELSTFDEWNVDALARCFDIVRKTLVQEQTRQEMLSAARKAAEKAALDKRLEAEKTQASLQHKQEQLQIEREAEENRLKAELESQKAREALALAKLEEQRRKAAEYDHRQRLNLAAADAWKEIWMTKQRHLVDAIYVKHYSSSWSGTYTLFGKSSFNNSLEKAKEHSMASIKRDWVFLPKTFVVRELTDTYVKFQYSTKSSNEYYSAQVRFDFDVPGRIVKSDFVITKGLLT